MTTPQLLHFAVLDISYTPTLTGCTVTCYTNNPCHLWLRQTETIPQQHVNTKNVRGAPVGTYIDQCFVVYNDLEQNEAGDTILHTFTIDPWQSCETRWFYFHGTIDGVVSPSASCIFSHQRECIFKLYSDQRVYFNTCDGEVYRQGIDLTWLQIHDGAATHNELSANRCFVFLSAYTTPDTWRQLVRTKLTFDLASIPANVEITGCSLYFWIINKSATFETTPTYAIVTAPAPPYNNIPLSDYNKFGATALSNILPWNSLIDDQYNHLDISPQHFSLFVPGQKCSLSIREMSNDAANTPPPWQSGHGQFIQFWSADATYWTMRPYLQIRGKLKD